MIFFNTNLSHIKRQFYYPKSFKNQKKVITILHTEKIP